MGQAVIGPDDDGLSVPDQARWQLDEERRVDRVDHGQIVERGVVDGTAENLRRIRQRRMPLDGGWTL